jgi:hypothetical protein
MGLPGTFPKAARVSRDAGLATPLSTTKITDSQSDSVGHLDILKFQFSLDKSEIL